MAFVAAEIQYTNHIASVAMLASLFAYRYLISYYLEVKKRLLSKAKNLRWEMKTEMDAEWFELYSRYICKRHKNGTMYPPKRDEFSHFAQTTWLTTLFLHIYDESNQLLGVAVTDVMTQCSSAFLYVFLIQTTHFHSVH